MTASGPIVPAMSAAVLAGGQSRRMGRDKATLVPPGQSLPLVDLVAEVLLTLSDDVLVIGGPSDRPVRPGVRREPDAPGSAGPLRGIAAALRAARHEWCLVVACDLPFLSPVLLRSLCAVRGDADAVVPRTPDADDPETMRAQPLHALYHRRCRPIALDLLASTGRAGALLDRVATRYVADTDLLRLDPELRSFTNLNTPDDLARAFGSGNAQDAGTPAHGLYSGLDPRSGVRDR